MSSTIGLNQRQSTESPRYSLMTAVFFWCGLVVVASNYLTIPMISVFADTFAVSPTTAAWAGSAFSFMYAIGSLFSGPVSDRYGRKQVILVGILLLTIITLVLGFINQLLLIIILRGLQGLAAASFAPVAVSFIGERFPATRIVTSIGVVSSSFLISGIFGQIVSSYLNSQFGWQSVFYSFSALYLLSAIVVLLLIPQTPAERSEGSLAMIFPMLLRILSNRSLLCCYAIAVMLLLTFVGMYTALGDYASHTFGLDEQDMLFVRAAGIIGMLLAPFAGKFTAKFGLHNVLRSGLALAIIGLMLLSMIESLPIMIAVSVIFVSGIALTVPSLITVVGDLGGTERGAAISMYTFILFVGASLGPIIAAALLQSGLFVLTFTTFACLLSIGFVISFFIKR